MDRGINLDLKEWRIVFIFFGLATIILFNFPSFSNLFVSRNEKTIAMAILDSNMMADNYFLYNNDTMKLGDKVSWYIQLDNKWGKTQYCQIKIKIVDDSAASPNISVCSPCLSPTIFALRKLVISDEVAYDHFNLSFIGVNKTGNNMLISKIMINDYLLDVDINIRGNHVKILFELWIFDDETNDFEFIISDEESTRCIWNQIWLYLIL